MKLMILNLLVRNLSFFNLPKLTTFIIFNLPGTLLLWTYDFQFIPETYNFQSTSVKLMIFNLPLWLNLWFSITSVKLMIFNLPLWILWFSIYSCETYNFQLLMWNLWFSIYLVKLIKFEGKLKIITFPTVNWK